MKNKPFYIIIAVLLGVILLQKFIGGSDSPPPARIDTVVKYVEVHDTIRSKPKYIKGETDTLWIEDIKYIPDTNYPKLLEQYTSLGNQFFTKNIYSTKFPIKYGLITVDDTVYANQSIGLGLNVDVVFPEKTITIVKIAPAKREFYVGPMVTVGNNLSGNSVNVAGLYKDKKNRVVGASVGWNGDLQIGLSTYIKIK